MNDLEAMMDDGCVVRCSVSLLMFCLYRILSLFNSYKKFTIYECPSFLPTTALAWFFGVSSKYYILVYSLPVRFTDFLLYHVHKKHIIVKIFLRFLWNILRVEFLIVLLSFHLFFCKVSQNRKYTWPGFSPVIFDYFI